MGFKIGDFVHVVDEDLSGSILRISDHFVVISCEDGFEYTYRPNQLLKTNSSSDMVEFEPFTSNEMDYKDTIGRSDSHPFDIKFQGTKPEFDLHIEELFPDKRFTTKHQALILQLEYIKAVLDRAIQLKIRNFILIHGVGQGVLKEELRSLLKDSYPNVEYFDASYTLYGTGATELILHGLGRT